MKFDLSSLSSGFYPDVEEILFSMAPEAPEIRRINPRVKALAVKARETMPDVFLPEAIVVEKPVVYRGKADVLSFSEKTGIRNSFLAHQMKGVDRIFGVVVTAGSRLDDRISNLSATDLPAALALEAAGTAAVDMISKQICEILEKDCLSKGLRTTPPYFPGFPEWPVQTGLVNVLDLFEEEDRPLPVKLTDSSLMIPLKSVAFILGAGENVNTEGNSCDYCEMKDRCKFKKTHQKESEILFKMPIAG